MKLFIELLKGTMIGVANIVPGLSGGTMAVVMNIYNILINALTEVIAHPIKVLKQIWIYIVGIGVGIIFGIFLISFLLETFPIPTTFLFVGLIIGAIPLISRQIDKENIRIYHYFICGFTITFISLLPFISSLGLTGNSSNPLIYLILGAISAATMIIPGISGSMVLMTVGYYDTIVNLIKNTIENLVSFNTEALISNLICLIPFGIGVILGIIFIAKLIKWLLATKSQGTHFAILGLVLASPVAVLLNVDFSGINIFISIISIITFCIGFFIAKYFSNIKE